MTPLNQKVDQAVDICKVVFEEIELLGIPLSLRLKQRFFFKIIKHLCKDTDIDINMTYNDIEDILIEELQ